MTIQKTIEEVNQEEVFSQPESTFENILEYFENYIKSYYAYKNEPAYKAIISFVIKYYLDEIYNLQMVDFKELYEQQVINRNIIDYLLVSIGLPEKLIKSLTTTSKFVIMKSFSDFERYKGTIKFFRSIGGAFSDKMSYYELYIDYDPTYINPVAKYLMTISKSKITNSSYFLISSLKNKYYIWFNYNKTGKDPELLEKIGIEINYDDSTTSIDLATEIIKQLNLTNDFFVNINATDILEIQLSEHGYVEQPSGGTTELKFKILNHGKDNGSWVLRPKPIYIHPKMDVVKDIFSYQEAYEKIPTLLLSEDQLNELKNQNNIVLPTKSNIILLDYTSTVESSYLNLLFFTILMEHIGDDYFSLFLTGSSGTTTMTYKTAFFLWFYLLAKYYNVTLEGVDLLYHTVMGTGRISDYTLNDIPILEEKYNKIKTRDELYSFYLEYIDQRYSRVFTANKPTIPVMADTLKKIDSDMFEYIENRIASAEDVSQDIRFLMDEIYASIVLSFDQYNDKPIISKYIPYLLQFLTQITTDIKTTDSYKIIYNLKPFHTEILDLARNKIEVDDKFNSILFNDEPYLWFNMIIASLLHHSDQASFKFTPKQDCESLSLNSIGFLNMKQHAAVKLFRDFELIFHFHFPIPEDLNKMRLYDVPDLLVNPKTQTTQLGIGSVFGEALYTMNAPIEYKIKDDFNITLEVKE